MEILGTVVSGGATGLIGAGVTHVVEYYKEKQKNAHELAVMQEARENMKLEIEGREKVAIIEGETQVNVGELKLLADSYVLDKATYSKGDSRLLIYVDVVRGLTRPVLTLGLVLFTVGLWATTNDPSLEEQIIATVLYTTTTAVLWWFGTRPVKK